MTWVIWQNQLVQQDEVHIHMGDRGYQYGDGLYEVIRVYQGQLFMEHEHFDRLERGAQDVRLKLPYTREQMIESIQSLIKAEKINNGYVYFQISRGKSVPRDHLIPPMEETEPVWTATVNAHDRDIDKHQEGMTAVLVEDKRWLNCHLKTLSLLGNVLSLDQAIQQGADDALLVRDGVFTEASASNLWFVKDGIIYTHPDGNKVLPGITKIAIRQLVKELGLTLYEQAYPVDLLDQAEEIFISNSVWEIVPIHTVDGKKVGSQIPGRITRMLQEAYGRLIEHTLAINIQVEE